MIPSNSNFFSSICFNDSMLWVDIRVLTMGKHIVGFLNKTITRPLHAQLLTYCDSHFIKKGLSLIHKSNQHHWNTYPHPRETIPFSFKIPPSRDTAPCLIQVRASIMSLRVLYTWSSPKSRYNKVSRRPFPALVLMCMWWSSKLTILTAYPTKPAGIFPFGKVGAGKANFLCGSLLPNFPEYGLPNQLENLNHYHKLLITCNVCIQYIDFFFSFLFLATGKLNIIPYTLKAYNKVSAINRLSKCSCCGM